MAACRTGSRSQGCHGILPSVPGICTGPPPTFDSTISQAHLLAMNLNLAISCNDSVLKMGEATTKKILKVPDR